MSLLLAARDPETGQAMDDRDVADNLLTFVTAGHETTALALTWAFYLLSHHPESEALIAAEVEAATGGGKLRPEHLDALPYTRQVVLEAMRLYPPVPVVVRAAIRDVDLDGIAVRSGRRSPSRSTPSTATPPCGTSRSASIPPAFPRTP